MKISTWNIERPTKSAKRLSLIKECLKSIDSDILILTETNVAVQLGGEYTAFHTVTLPEPYYKEGERRATDF